MGVDESLPKNCQAKCAGRTSITSVLGRLGQVDYALEARLGFTVFSWLAWATQLKLSKEMKM